MRLLEYESKEIISKKGIPTPAGIVISSPGPISLSTPVVIKAQIPVGGRQKAGELWKPWIKGRPDLRSSKCFLVPFETTA